MPHLSRGKVVVAEIGASSIKFSSKTDPRVFLHIEIQPTYPCIATTSLATFLIDSGATHNVMSNTFIARAGLQSTPSLFERTILGFDGSKSGTSREIGRHSSNHLHNHKTQGLL